MPSQSTLLTLQLSRNVTYPIVLSSNTESNRSSNDKISNPTEDNSNDDFNISREKSENLQDKYMK